MIHTAKTNQQVKQQEKRFYSANLTALLVCTFLLGACAQPNSKHSQISSENSDDPWAGVTCPVGQPLTTNAVNPHVTDSITTNAQEFDVCQPEAWGAAKNVVGVKHLYISSQPDAETFAIARKRGVSRVINLRDPAESEWDEENTAEQAGLGYYNVPIAGKGQSFNADAINQISALVKQHKDEKILLHCSSGNRASAWLAIHLVKDHEFSTDNAISLAKQTGLTSPVIEVRVNQYLQEQSGR
jgi:protein tyrosine phosphatase (PTP) superfamily phosphohydrolase (DUF442 family)